MARFAETIKSQSEAINVAVDVANQAGQSTRTSRTDGAATLTAGETVNGVVVQGGTPGAFALTFPTAADLVAAIPNCQVGSSFDFTLVNGGDGTVTLTTNTGLTLAGTMAVPTNKSQLCKGIVTAVDTPAVTIQGILNTPA